MFLMSRRRSLILLNLIFHQILHLVLNPSQNQMHRAATEEPAVQSNDTVTETSSETIKDLSASTETQSDVVSLATVSTAATPVTETSTQNDDSASITPPDTMSVTLFRGDNPDNPFVTLTSDTTSEPWICYQSL